MEPAAFNEMEPALHRSSRIRHRFGSKVSTSTPSKPPRPPPPGARAGLSLFGAGAAGEAAAAAAGIKRTRELFAGGSSNDGHGGHSNGVDDTSPSNLVKTKQQRQ